MSDQQLADRPQAVQTDANKDVVEVTQEEPARPAFPDGGLRAWSVAIANAGVMFCTLGYVNSWGVFQAYYSHNQLRGENISAISWIGSLQTFCIFSSSVIGGPLFDRFGAKVIYPPSVVYIFTIFMTSLCKEYYQFMLAQGVLGGITQGLVMAPAMAATPQYFMKKRGEAMGFAIAGAAIGGIIHPIALNQMFTKTSLGFGWSVRVEGFIILTILFLSCIPIRARLPPRKTNFLLPKAFKEVGYSSLVFGAFFNFMGIFPSIFFLPSFGIAKGMSPNLAFYLSAILNAASCVGRIVSSRLSDRFGKLNTFAAAGICTGVVVFCWQRVESNAAIIVYTAVFGFFSGSIISGGMIAITNCAKEPKTIGTYMGMGNAWISISSLIAPPIGGALRDTAMGFKTVAIFSGAVSLAGGIFVLFVVKHLSGVKILSLR